MKRDEGLEVHESPFEQWTFAPVAADKFLSKLMLTWLRMKQTRERVKQDECIRGLGTVDGHSESQHDPWEQKTQVKKYM